MVRSRVEKIRPAFGFTANGSFFDGELGELSESYAGKTQAKVGYPLI